MKNKKSLLILIPAVIGIWGYIVFTFFSKPEAVEVSQSLAQINELENKNNTPINEIKLNLNYKDPFLKGKFKPQPEKKINRSFENRVKPNPKSIKPISIVEERWPKIEYKGFLKPSNTDKVAIIKIESQTMFKSQNDSIGDILVLEITPDSLILMKDKTRKNFRKL